jgi:branched-chain amino acid transport system substrate-binding protein
MNKNSTSKRRLILSAMLATLGLSGVAQAQNTNFKVGLILPMTGPFASTGHQIDAAVKLFMQENGTTVAGQKIEVVLKDDGGVPEQTKRIAQELVVGDKVDALAGFGITPAALAASSVATQGKVPAIIMAAATSGIVSSSPYFVRTSYTMTQSAGTMGEWANKQKFTKVVTMVSDYGPGIDAEKIFKERVVQGGGQVVGEIRVPMRNPDFAPFLQKVRDLQPQAVFVFIPSGPAVTLMKEFVERGLDKSNIKLIGDGGVTDDDTLNDMGDASLGVVTSFHYSASHESALNKKFVEAFSKANNGMRPNFMAVGGYDGMQALYKALQSTNGQARGEALVNAMKGLSFESPRGPIQINAQSRDIVQNVYIRKVEKKNSQLWNTEIDVSKNVAP